MMKTRPPTATEDSAAETAGQFPFGINVEGLPCIKCPARTSDLCGALSDKNLPALFEASTLIELRKGETLFLDDQPAQHIFNVITGTITVFRMGPSGQRQVVNFLFTGNLLGITPEDHYGFSAEACTPAILCRWERAKFEDLLILFPNLDRQFRLISSKVLARSIDLAYSLGQLTAEQRLAAFINQLHERQSKMASDPMTVLLTMSRADMADYLGLKVETVSRALSKLKVKGVISLPASDRVVIIDRDHLRRLSQSA